MTHKLSGESGVLLLESDACISLFSNHSDDVSNFCPLVSEFAAYNLDERERYRLFIVHCNFTL